MKNLLVFILFWTLFVSFGQNVNNERFMFLKNKHDFGDIVQGEKREVAFIYKNDSKYPVIIENVITQCGCTATEWGKEHVLPNVEGEVKITFDSKGKVGYQRKVITVKTSDGESHRLVITANIMEEE